MTFCDLQMIKNINFFWFMDQFWEETQQSNTLIAAFPRILEGFLKIHFFLFYGN